MQADVSFHSGYYPSIFDQARAPKDTRHLTAKEGEPEAEEHEKQMNFLGPPRDWIERFGRHFIITEHTHLEGNNEREILPWLKLSAELDPQKIETYTVAAYWLRDLGKVKEAEEFLREGLRNNPDSYEILFELGRLYHENKPRSGPRPQRLGISPPPVDRASGRPKEPRPQPARANRPVNLSRLEENQGNLARAIDLLELGKKTSPHPEALQQQIDDLKRKLAAPPSPAPR